MSASQLLSLVEEVAAELRVAGIDARNGLGQGTLEPFDEAAWLVLWALALPLSTDLNLAASRPISAEERSRVQALVHRRIQERQPTAYLTGQAWLCGLPFYVDKRSIIPRSFIAELMSDASLDVWLSEQTCRVLDLFLMPELAQSLREKDWAARVWVRGDGLPARLSVARTGWQMVVRFERLEFSKALPPETWQPTAEQAGDILRLDAARYGQLLEFITK